MTEGPKLPTSRWGRLGKMATLGARAGAGMLLKTSGVSEAEAAAKVLGQLRGLAAKVGQMASYVDGVVPEGQRPAYEASLKMLRENAPRSSGAAILAVVEKELGKPIGELFASFDEEPFASASIGQVHRARLEDGTLVACKVQHPGIRQAVESDLASAGLLESIVGAAGGRRLGSHDLFAIARDRFREELDYAREADNTERFAKMHEGDPKVRFARVIRDRSSASVLTTTLVTGLSFDLACAAPLADRRAWGETLWRFVFRSLLGHGTFNADPHPGNYLFHEGGAVTFLDHGCVQRITKTRSARARAMHERAIAHDEAGFAAAVKAMLETRPGKLEDMTVDYTRTCFEPLFASPYKITRRYAASLVERMHAMGVAARKAKDEELVVMPPEMLFMNRLQFGFYSVIARLDVTLDFAVIESGLGMFTESGDEEREAG